MNIRIDFTGKLLVGNGFIFDYYTHGGYQHSWSYENLMEFVFEKGRMIESKDLSYVAEMIREEIDRNSDFFDPLFKSQVPSYFRNEEEDGSLPNFKDGSNVSDYWWLTPKWSLKYNL